MFRGGRRDHLCGKNSHLDKFLRPEYKCEDNTINLRSSGDKSSIMQIISQCIQGLTRVTHCKLDGCDFNVREHTCLVRGIWITLFFSSKYII